MRCWGCGPGLAIMRAAAICMPARRRWRRWAGFRARRGVARVARHRAVYGQCDRRDRLRPAGAAGGWQYRAGRGADICHRGAASRRQAGDRQGRARLSWTIRRRARAPGDFAQALFDLGATICTPRSPACGSARGCGIARRRRRASPPRLPARAKKPERPQPHRHRLCADGCMPGDVLLHPPAAARLAGRHAGLARRRRRRAARIGGMRARSKHVFTHFALTLTRAGGAAQNPARRGALRAPAATAPLPSVMRKALDAGRRALDDGA